MISMEAIKIIVREHEGKEVSEIVKIIRKELPGEDISPKKVSGYLRRHGLTKGRKKGTAYPKNRIFSDDMIEFVKEISPGRSNEEIRAMFNQKYYMDVRRVSIERLRSRKGFRNGLDTRLKPGNTIGSETRLKPGNSVGKGSWFKPGNRPDNCKEIGTEFLRKDGKIYVKTENGWRVKAQYVWEREFGPIPKGNTIIAKNGDINDTRIDNLMLVSRGEIGVRNLRFSDIEKDTNETAFLMARIKVTISKRKKNLK